MAKLERSLGLPLLFFYGTGMILGAGIYSVIGAATAHAGGTLWIALLLAGCSALLTGLSYAELSSLFPKAAAEYIYLKEAFPRASWLAASMGCMMALSGAATAATVVTAFLSYASHFVDIATWWAAPALLIFFTGTALFGIRASGWVTVLSTLIELGGLLLIIGLGFMKGDMGRAIDMRPTAGTLAGASLIIFSFFGFENIATLAEESKRPEKDIPRAMLGSIFLSILVYLGVCVAVLALAPVEEVAKSKGPLMYVAGKISPSLGTLLAAIALFSTANTGLIALIGSSRILFGMAEAGALPAFLGKVLPERKTPWVASLVALLLALGLLPLGELETMAQISAFATMLAFFSVNLGLIVLRSKRPQLKRPFRVPLFPLTPVLGMLFSLAPLTQFPAKVNLLGGLAFALPTFFFFFTKTRSPVSRESGKRSS